MKARDMAGANARRGVWRKSKWGYALPGPGIPPGMGGNMRQFLAAGAITFLSINAASAGGIDTQGWYLGLGNGYATPTAIAESGQGVCTRDGGKVLQHEGKLYCASLMHPAQGGHGRAEDCQRRGQCISNQCVAHESPAGACKSGRPQGYSRTAYRIHVVGHRRRAGERYKRGQIRSPKLAPMTVGRLSSPDWKPGSYQVEVVGPGLVAAVDRLAPAPEKKSESLGGGVGAGAL